MKTRIDIDTQTFVRFWLVVLGLGLVILLFITAQVALIILATSLFLALALNAPVAWIAKRLPGRSRVAASAIAYVSVILILSAVIFLVIPPIIQQSAKFAQNIPTLVDQATNSSTSLRDVIAQYNLQPSIDSAIENVRSNAATWAGNIGQNVVNGIGSIFSFFAAALLVLVLTFLMLIEGPSWIKRIWGLYQNQHRMLRHKRIATRMYGVLNGYITGQLTVSTIGAVAAGLAVVVLSFVFPEVPIGLAFPTAAITFTLSLIPMFGATVGGVIIAILILLNSLPAAVIYGIYFIVYQQIENNIISPKIQSKRNDLSALAVLASVTLGLYMFGIVGGIIAIPIAGSIGVLIDEYLNKAQNKRLDNGGDPAKELIEPKKKASKDARIA